MRRVINNADQWRKMGQSMNFGSPMEVVVKPFRSRRSLDQNAKMHVMIRDLAAHLGYTQSELKDYLKHEYGPTKTLQIGETQKVIPLSTSEYNRAEAGEIIEILYMLGAECGYAFEEPQNAASGDGCG
jgi:hypothetical protein